ncbi:aminotransferase class I/II-fold pyridoxal phosphate-dependent enzyme [Comamonadaceae bacterium M7527]|nr:aminotransferase class I/II-fold pyridoxal phosphate-dependent enzyme [Comamonadaceae bacterium M7527]
MSEELWFGKDLSQPEPIPEAGIERAVALMHSGRLHRYGETGGGAPEPSLLEQAYAAYVGAKYCVAMSSCGATMFVALKALGVQPGDKVLTSTFTLAPVPGAIAHAGAHPVLVETTANYTTDLDDLAQKAATSGAKVLLISHMRGHITDMQAVRAICDANGIAVVEDCAHTMGARWDGRFSGTWGAVGCFSTQTYKHINSGEGGLLVTDDEDICAQAILMSGSYMLYSQHTRAPSPEVFERWRYKTPNFSLRMSNQAAAMLRPQLADMPRRTQVWNGLYATLAESLAGIPHVVVPARDPRESFVASSIQFTLDLDTSAILKFLAGCDSRGLHIKWFGRDEPQGFTSNYTHWHYMREPQALPRSLTLMQGLCDMRIALSMTDADCDMIGRIVRASMNECLA